MIVSFFRFISNSHEERKTWLGISMNFMLKFPERGSKKTKTKNEGRKKPVLQILDDSWPLSQEPFSKDLQIMTMMRWMEMMMWGRKKKNHQTPHHVHSSPRCLNQLFSCCSWLLLWCFLHPTHDDCLYWNQLRINFSLPLFLWAAENFFFFLPWNKWNGMRRRRGSRCWERRGKGMMMMFDMWVIITNVKIRMRDTEDQAWPRKMMNPAAQEESAFFFFFITRSENRIWGAGIFMPRVSDGNSYHHHRDVKDGHERITIKSSERRTRSWWWGGMGDEIHPLIGFREDDGNLLWKQHRHPREETAISILPFYSPFYLHFYHHANIQRDIKMGDTYKDRMMERRESLDPPKNEGNKLLFVKEHHLYDDRFSDEFKIIPTGLDSIEF